MFKKFQFNENIYVYSTPSLGEKAHIIDYVSDLIEDGYIPEEGRDVYDIVEDYTVTLTYEEYLSEHLNDLTYGISYYGLEDFEVHKQSGKTTYIICNIIDMLGAVSLYEPRKFMIEFDLDLGFEYGIDVIIKNGVLDVKYHGLNRDEDEPSWLKMLSILFEKFI